MSNAIQRPSITTSLKSRYKASDKAAYPVAGNFIDTTNEFSKNFTPKQLLKTTELTARALNYSDSLGVSTKKYKG